MTSVDLAPHAAPIEVGMYVIPRTEIEKYWRDLESRATASFFQSWSWIGSLLDVCEFVPNLVIARSFGRVVGLGLISPITRGRFGFGWPSLSLNEIGVGKFDCIMIEDNNFLAESAMQDAVTRACFRYLSEASLHWREFRLSGVPDSVVRIAHGLSMPIAHDQIRGSPVVELKDIDVDNLSYLGRNARQQIRRSLQLYQKRGEVKLTTSHNLKEALIRFAEMERLHRQRWSTKGTAGAFAEPFFRRFHDNLILRAFPLGQVDVLRIAAGSETLGLLYTFFYNREVYVYQNGFRYEEDARLKPGLVSHVLAIKYCQQRGFGRYKLLAGDSRYKRSLAPHSNSLHWVSIRRPHWAFRFEAVARKMTGREP